MPDFFKAPTQLRRTVLAASAAIGVLALASLSIWLASATNDPDALLSVSDQEQATVLEKHDLSPAAHPQPSARTLTFPAETADGSGTPSPEATIGHSTDGLEWDSTIMPLGELAQGGVSAEESGSPLGAIGGTAESGSTGGTGGAGNSTAQGDPGGAHGEAIRQGRTGNDSTRPTGTPRTGEAIGQGRTGNDSTRPTGTPRTGEAIGQGRTGKDNTRSADTPRTGEAIGQGRTGNESTRSAGSPAQNPPRTDALAGPVRPEKPRPGPSPRPSKPAQKARVKTPDPCATFYDSRRDYCYNLMNSLTGRQRPAAAAPDGRRSASPG